MESLIEWKLWRLMSKHGTMCGITQVFWGGKYPCQKTSLLVCASHYQGRTWESWLCHTILCATLVLPSSGQWKDYFEGKRCNPDCSIPGIEHSLFINIDNTSHFFSSSTLPSKDCAKPLKFELWFYLKVLCCLCYNRIKHAFSANTFISISIILFRYIKFIWKNYHYFIKNCRWPT